MNPVVGVVQLTDSFGQIWPDLVAAAGGHANRVTGGATTPHRFSEETCAIVLAAAGREDSALAELAVLTKAAELPIAVVAAAAEHRLVVSALRAGAEEYFALPADLGALRAWMEEKIDLRKREHNRLALAKREHRRHDFSQMLGDSAALHDAIRRAEKVIPWHDTTVLITGETGTGKELLARAIHYNGVRAAKPFVEINCTALPSNLLEAEVFGYEKGAFTDAKMSKPGLFESAEGGTLFLDEIGDLPLDLQAKLLRVLETKRVRRLGSVKDVQVDMRILAATNIDLLAASREGRFRSDLYYRLSVVPIHLPPLRERADDVLLLAEHFLGQLARRDIPTPRSLPPETRKALLRHGWPGNVRELKNSIERAVVLGEGSLSADDLFLPQESMAKPSPRARYPFPASLAELESMIARDAVDACHGNKSEAARVLGVSRRHLYSLLAFTPSEAAE